MLITNRDEAKRTKVYHIVSRSAFLVLVLIVGFFLIKMFTSNPLEGTWLSEDSDLTLNVKNNSTITVNIPEIGEDTDVKVKVEYSIDKESKIITIKKNQEELEKVAEASEGQYDADAIEAVLGNVLTSFDYSVDGEELTLTEREYGEQMLFTRE